jgi:hypothetical protein
MHTGEGWKHRMAKRTLKRKNVLNGYGFNDTFRVFSHVQSVVSSSRTAEWRRGDRKLACRKIVQEPSNVCRGNRKSDVSPASISYDPGWVDVTRAPAEHSERSRGKPDFAESLLKLRSSLFLLQLLLVVRGVRGGAIGWGTALKAGRWRVRFPMESLEFFSDLTFLYTVKSTLSLWCQFTENPINAVRKNRRFYQSLVRCWSGSKGWKYNVHVHVW